MSNVGKLLGSVASVAAAALERVEHPRGRTSAAVAPTSGRKPTASTFEASRSPRADASACAGGAEHASAFGGKGGHDALWGGCDDRAKEGRGPRRREAPPVDPELANLKNDPELQEMLDGVYGNTPPPADPTVQAMMDGLNGSSDSNAMDPELAAMVAGTVDASGAPAAANAPMDPDLQAMMAQLGNGQAPPLDSLDPLVRDMVTDFDLSGAPMDESKLDPTVKDVMDEVNAASALQDKVDVAKAATAEPQDASPPPDTSPGTEVSPPLDLSAAS